MTTNENRGRVVRWAIPLLIAGMCIAGAVAPALAQRGTGRMQGKVTDPQGNPLVGVSVTAFNPELTPSTLTAETDEEGNWAILGLARANWKFTFELVGYIPYEVDATVSGMGRNPNMDVTMEPLASDAVGAGVAAAGGVNNRELFDEGTAAFDAGDYTVAIEKWTLFAEANPEIYQVWFNVGNAHRELGNTEEARAAYARVLEQDPNDTRANYALGEMVLDEGDASAALPYFEKALANAPDDPAVYYNVGELYFAQGEAAHAIELYEQALAVDPNYLPAHKQIGFAYLNTGNNEAAIAAFEKYVELAPPDDPELAVIQDILAALKGGRS